MNGQFSTRTEEDGKEHTVDISGEHLSGVLTSARTSGYPNFNLSIEEAPWEPRARLSGIESLKEALLGRFLTHPEYTSA